MIRQRLSRVVMLAAATQPSDPSPTARTSLPPARETESHATPAGLKATPMSSVNGRKARWVMKEGAPCGRSNRRRPATPGPGHADAPPKTHTTDPVPRASAPERP